MADILYYPHDYLPLPLMDGYGFKHVSPLLRTEMTSGRARQRRRYLSTPTNNTVKWIFTDDIQARIFEGWFRDTLGDGVNWFMMELQTPRGLEFYKCRFTEIYEGPTLLPPKYWQCSATLELWERPLVAPGWGRYPELLSGSDLLDLAMNKEWPV